MAREPALEESTLCWQALTDEFSPWESVVFLGTAKVAVTHECLTRHCHMPQPPLFELRVRHDRQETHNTTTQPDSFLYQAEPVLPGAQNLRRSVNSIQGLTRKSHALRASVGSFYRLFGSSRSKSRLRP